MRNEFILYQQALKLKELGFNEPCIILGDQYLYRNSKFCRANDGAITVFKSFDDELVIAPTFSQAFKWFRNKHGYLYHITYFDPYKAQTPGNADYQGFVLFPHAGIHKLPKMSYDTYEEVELACFDKLIEIIKTK